MIEAREAWNTLHAAGILHAVWEAHEATTRTVFGALSRAEGFKERSFGYTAFDVLESRLDQVFGVGTAEPLAVRDDLNGSPGWRHGPYRLLLRRYDLGAIDEIRWDKASPTKQAVAKQQFAEDPQLALDLGTPLRPATPDPVTLVLAHSASEEPLELELFLGRPRFNDDGGRPWHWRSQVDRAALGPDPRRAVEPTEPLWSDEEIPVPLRLRDRAAGSAETA
ncbi:hypothetical protein DPM19_31175 [Actinomadura craniellae]|uniref:Uncharacterized protein n=1 Tax=Actinomadura craniellae TaxID=2231787 RepID=A0A365GZ57_9ACTN|nr:hypothetical protein [Actinomadura craniellae]RAY11223.1 hypothetical protein DPM19_31175 [Actinomadura craniellae]